MSLPIAISVPTREEETLPVPVLQTEAVEEEERDRKIDISSIQSIGSNEPSRSSRGGTITSWKSTALMLTGMGEEEG